MAIRFYVVPLENDGLGHRGPKYFEHRFDPDPPALIAGVRWQLMDYGMEAVALVAADVTNAQNTTLSANLDVTAAPLNLDNTVNASTRLTAEEKLESYGIPANWITVGMSWRSILRGVVAQFSVAQRLSSKGYTRLTPPGVTLATTYADMPSPYREDLLDSIDALGYDREGLGAQSTLRDLMTAIAGQSSPVTMLGVTI